MADTATTEELERQLAQLRSEFTAFRESRQAVLEDMRELFAEVAKALDVTAMALDALVPLEENDDAESTGVMGRSAELMALVGIFHNNLTDLGERIESLASA